MKLPDNYGPMPAHPAANSGITRPDNRIMNQGIELSLSVQECFMLSVRRVRNPEWMPASMAFGMVTLAQCRALPMRERITVSSARPLVSLMLKLDAPYPSPSGPYAMESRLLQRETP